MLKFKRIRFFNGKEFDEYVVGEGDVSVIDMDGPVARVTIKDGIFYRYIMIHASFIEGELL